MQFKTYFSLSLLILPILVVACSQQSISEPKVTSVDITGVSRIDTEASTGKKYMYPVGLISYRVKATQRTSASDILFCQEILNGKDRGRGGGEGDCIGGISYREHNEEEWALKEGSNNIQICCSLNSCNDQICDSYQYVVD